jgi:hypothetical protein
VPGQQQCNSPQAKRHGEIAWHFADRSERGEFLDHELVTAYQIHVASTSIDTSRLRCIGAILFFWGCTQYEHLIDSNSSALHLQEAYHMAIRSGVG